jgi:hypothetical protein
MIGGIVAKTMENTCRVVCEYFYASGEDTLELGCRFSTVDMRCDNYGRDGEATATAPAAETP